MTIEHWGKLEDLFNSRWICLELDLEETLHLTIDKFDDHEIRDLEP
jgi:hypothetical protein